MPPAAPAPPGKILRFANKGCCDSKDPGSTFTHAGCKPPPLAGLNTCTPVAEPGLASAVTETKTTPELDTTASNGFPAVGKFATVAVTVKGVVGVDVTGG